MLTYQQLIQTYSSVDYVIHWNYLHSLFSQSIPAPIQRYIDKAVESFVAGIVDTAVLSCTSRLAVANSAAFGSDMIFSVSGADGASIEFEQMLDRRGFEMRCVPAPVAWVSQYPGEEEYLWPTSTILFPKAVAERDYLLKDQCASKKVYEFYACYAWNSSLGCYGGSASTDLESGMKIVIKHGVPFMDAVCCVYYLLLRKDIMVNAVSKERVISNAFSMFDRDGNGTISVRFVEELFHDVIFIMAQLDEAPLALLEFVDKEIDAAWYELYRELMSLRDPDDGYIRWRSFQQHFLLTVQGSAAKQTGLRRFF